MGVRRVSKLKTGYGLGISCYAPVASKLVKKHVYNAEKVIIKEVFNVFKGSIFLYFCGYGKNAYLFVTT